jgi:hypothetical protein
MEIPPMPNYQILLIVFSILLCLFVFIFYINPYQILTFARIPIMILCIIIVLGFFIFIEYYLSKDLFKGDTVNELWSNFLKYCLKYGYYLFYFFTISLIGYILFKAVEKGFMFSFDYSFLISIGLLILLLTLVQSFTQNEKTKNDLKFDMNTLNFNNPNFELIKNLIMYIPCLITDLIDYAKKDYANTPSTVFIVFMFTLVYLSIFYLIPTIRKQQYKNDGVFLVDKSLPLNTDVLSITSHALNEKIHEKRPFYDKWFKKIIELEPQEKRSETDIRIQEEDASLNLIVPPDIITLPYYMRQIEGFTSLQNQDTVIIPTDLFKKRIKDIYEDSLDEKKSFGDYKARMRKYIKDHPQILTMMEKAQYMYSTVFASWDAVKSIPHLLLGSSDTVQTYSYHYAITLWVYFHQLEDTMIQVIYSFGSRPSLYYDPVNATLFVAINYGTSKQKIIYKTKQILYQRWNFIVMNYRYGTLDIFINNNLVGTYPDVLTYLDPYDILLVGSRENKNIGGICNMKYYELPLGVRKINSIYKTFHNKKIPL